MQYSNYKTALGLRIAHLRETRNLSQRRFSTMIELDRVTLCRIEGGIGNPTIETLHRIAEGLGVDLLELMMVEELSC